MCVVKSQKALTKATHMNAVHCVNKKIPGNTFYCVESRKRVGRLGLT